MVSITVLFFFLRSIVLKGDDSSEDGDDDGDDDYGDDDEKIDNPPFSGGEKWKWSW